MIINKITVQEIVIQLHVFEKMYKHVPICIIVSNKNRIDLRDSVEGITFFGRASVEEIKGIKVIYSDDLKNNEVLFALNTI